MQVPVNEPIGFEQIRFDGQSIFLIQVVLHPDIGVGVAHQPSAGSGIIHGGLASRQAGLGLQVVTDALSRTSNFMLIIDQTKRGNATKSAIVVPKISSFLVPLGSNLKLLTIDIYS